MHISKVSSATLAAAAAMLFSTGVATQTFAADATVHCAGVNSCKGSSECKSAKNECKGQNSCKGTGWVSKTKAECEKEGGKVAK